MATSGTWMYKNARSKFARKQWDWVALNVKCALVSAGYSPSRNHVFMSEVTGVVARGDLVTNKAETAGICRCDIPEFLALFSPQVIVGMILYIDTGNDVTSSLIYFSDEGVGFPFTPAGINYFIGYDQLNGGFFEV